MKRKLTTALLLATSIFIGITSAKAQGYKDYVTENPDADADIQLVSDYVNTLIAGDVDKAASMLAGNYMGYGPGPDDSATVQQTIDAWKQNYTMQQNRKVSFLPATFNVLSGDQAGHWVTTWGTYTFTQNGKDIKLPYQYTAHIKDGKIDKDIIYFDQLAVLKALGYTIKDPSK